MNGHIEVIRGEDAIGLGRSALASIGIFDGMHQGHRRVLATLRDRSRRLGKRALAITFHPRPELVLFPERALPDLMTLDQRVEAIRAAGAQDVVVIHFTRQFAQLSAEAFIEWLRRQGDVDGLCVGEDFRFGPRAAYDVSRIRALGMPVEGVSLVPGKRPEFKASSTHIRQAIALGCELPLAMRYA